MTDAAARPVAIRCGGLLDVETGEMSGERVVHVGVDGRVAAIGSAGDAIPDDATTIDLSAYAVLPGLDPLGDLTELERPVAVVKGGQTVFEAAEARA